MNSCKVARTGLVCLLCLCSSSCVWKTQRIEIAYTVQEGVEEIAGAEGAQVTVKVLDARTHRKTVGRKKTVFGITSDAIAISNEVHVLLKLAIETELAARGFSPSETGTPVEVILRDFRNEFIVTTFDRSAESQARLVMKVAVPTPNGEPLFSSAIHGEGVVYCVRASQEIAKRALERALRDAVKKLMRNREFLDVLLAQAED